MRQGTGKSLTFFNSVLTQTYRILRVDLIWPVGLYSGSLFLRVEKRQYTRTNPDHDEDGAVVEVGELCAQQDEEPEGGECGEEGRHHPGQPNPRLKQ